MISHSSRFWIVVAGFFGIAGVGGGAFGYHWLEGDAAMREIFATAVQYHMWHTLALFGVAWLIGNRPASAARWAARAGWFFTAGILLFSGSLYAFCITGTVPVPGATPIGGALFIAGWAMIAWSAMRKDPPEQEKP